MIRFAAPLYLLLILLAALPIAWTARGQRARASLRVLALALVALAIADPRWMSRSDRNNVVYLVDRSASVARTSDLRLTELRITALSETHPGWRYGVVSFAATADVDSPLGTSPRLANAPGLATATSIDAAVRLGLSLLPDDEPGQLVLFSDGRFPEGKLSATAEARMAGIPIHVVPSGGRLPLDARLIHLEAPAEVPAGRPIELRASLATEGGGKATLALYRDGALAAVQAVELTEGITRCSLVDTPTSPGLVEYRAIVKRDGDPVHENDARSTLVRTTDRPTLLVVDPRGSSAVPTLLRAVGMNFVERTDIPSLGVLADVRQVILAGVALPDLTAAEVDALAVFVRELGGGLLVTHGEIEAKGFQSGGIESLLPVTFSVPEIGQDPSLAVVYLLDRSSSMGELATAKRKIRIVREAAVASLLVLPPETLVGIVAFYDEYEWAYPLQPLGDGTQAYLAIASIDAFGGTDLFSPLNDAVDQLLAARARVKHIVLVSDGQTTEAGRDYPALFQKLLDHPEVTLSAIAVSSSPNVPFLEGLVAASHGTLYYALDFATLPQVALEVTQRLGRSRFVLGETPVSADSAWLSLARPPPVEGYVLTYPKPGASTLLRVGEDPLFSTWRIGLGSVSLLNTDLDGAWSRAWLEWDGIIALFGQMLKTTDPLVAHAAGLRTYVTVGPERSTLAVDALTPDGDFADHLRLAASLVPVGLDVPLRQSAPGFYTGSFPTPPEGAYALVGQEAGTSRAFVLPLAIPYAREFDAFGVDTAALADLASATGGRVLAADATLTPATAQRPSTEHALFPLLLALALGALLTDLALRRRRPRRALSD